MTSFGLSLRFAFFYAAVFVALGVYVPFWPLWLETHGLGVEQIGLLLALSAWIKIASTLFAGQLADRSARPRIILSCLALIAVGAFAAFLIVRDFWAVLVVQLVAAAGFQALIPLGESQAMSAVTKAGIDYGRVRLWGSLTFIAGNLAAGALIATHGADWVLWLILAALSVTVIATLVLPAQSAAHDGAAPHAALGSLLGNRPFLLFLLTVSLLQASHAVYYGFSALHWQAAGYSAATIGWLWAEGVIAEVLLFIAGAVLVRRFGPLGLVSLAAVGGLVRWSVLAATTELWALAVVQTLHALTFGAAHLGTMHFIARHAPPGLSATAQSLYAALSGGLALGLAMFAAGHLYAAWQGGAYVAMAGLSGVGLLLAWWLSRRPPGSRINGTADSG
jgi:PPP family 3-phenylpropionic acid transporter